jgi:hypothetical protein
MNFKSLILFAGAVALASASSPVGEEDSNKLAQSQDEEESNQMAETACHPGPAKCAACLSAPARRIARARQIAGWAHQQGAVNGYHYRTWLATRSKYLKYYGSTYYYAHLKAYRAGHAGINRSVAAAYRTADYRYANCK